MEDIKALFAETSELASDIGDLTIAWAKKKGHNPNLILKIVGDGLVMSSKLGNFNKYKPRYSGLLRSLDNDNLANCILDFMKANESFISKGDGFTNDDILHVLNEKIDIEKESKQ